jgi:GNAT superfamily N-acetyltransferase
MTELKTIRAATDDDIEAIVPLMLAYCDFYEVEHPDEAGLTEMAKTLIDSPDDKGFLLVAAEDSKPPVGFAACGWKWSSLRGARCVVLEDLYIDPGSRGEGIADRLIGEAADIARRNGAVAMLWETQPTNKRAQAVYNRVGGKPETLIEYELVLGDGE